MSISFMFDLQGVGTMSKSFLFDLQGVGTMSKSFMFDLQGVGTMSKSFLLNSSRLGTMSIISSQFLIFAQLHTATLSSDSKIKYSGEKQILPICSVRL